MATGRGVFLTRAGTGGAFIGAAFLLGRAVNKSSRGSFATQNGAADGNLSGILS